MPLPKRRLGRTNLEVTAIAFGGLPMQRCALDEAGPVLHAALDAGINFIDTARLYTDSEEKIGRHAAARRHEYYLATKSMARDAAGMTAEINASLKTMRTDWIDLYQAHNVKTRRDLETILAPGGALDALKAARDAGKIRHIGVTGHNIPLLVECVQTGAFETVQVPFNFVERQAEDELFPLAAKTDTGIIVMKPLGGGQFSHPGRALRFVIGHCAGIAIPGMDEPRHVAENLRAALEYAPLTTEELSEMEAEAAVLGKNFCRRCGYCMPCDAGIDIPTTFILHLQYTRYGMKQAIPRRYAAMTPASRCTGCGRCENRCPYNLSIRERLKRVAEDLDPPAKDKPSPA